MGPHLILLPVYLEKLFSFPFTLLTSSNSSWASTFLTLSLNPQTLSLYFSSVAHPWFYLLWKLTCLNSDRVALFIHTGFLQGLLFLLHIKWFILTCQRCYSCRSVFLSPVSLWGSPFIGSCQADPWRSQSVVPRSKVVTLLAIFLISFRVLGSTASWSLALTSTSSTSSFLFVSGRPSRASLSAQLSSTKKLVFNKIQKSQSFI